MKSATFTSRLTTAITLCVTLNHIKVGAFTSPAHRTIAIQHHTNPTSSIKRTNIFPTIHHHKYTSIKTTRHQSSSKTSTNIDPLILRASQKLTFAAWLSWWSQLILTVISSITFLFARNVLESQTNSSIEFGRIATKFLLPGVGIVTSIMSIVWTWGGRRLGKRLVKPRSTMGKVQAANLLRRLITVGCTLNLIGLLTSLLGAQYIVGTLVAKAMQNVVGFGSSMGAITSQVLQPLDVLVVQANTNVLTSHFVSLGCLLWLTRMVDLLDPPSLEEDS